MSARVVTPWARPMDASLSYVTSAGAAGAIAVDGSGAQNAVDAFTVRWGRPAGYAQPNPGELSLTVEHAAGVAPLPYGSRIALKLTDGVQTVDVGLGWLSSYSRKAISGGRQLTRMTLEDALQRAANTRLSAAPWPAQTWLERLQAVNAASPIGPLLDLQDLVIPGQGAVAPRDVDNVAALDVIRRSIPFGWTVGETAGGLLRPRPAEGNALYWSRTSAPASSWWRLSSPVVLPLDAVEDPREAILDRAGLMTHCSVEFQEFDTSTSTYTGGTLTYTAAGPTADKFTSSAFTTQTDLGAVAGFGGYDYQATINRAELLADENAEPVERWPAQRIALDRLTQATALAMVSIGRHASGLITLGAAGGPTYQVLAGILEYRRGLAGLQVELADARQSLVVPLEWAQIPTRNLDYSPGIAAPDFPQYFAAQGTVTFLDTITTGNLEDWRTHI